jgi:hypothetical protein
MINVEEVVMDPDLTQAFDVYRNYGSFKPGGWSEDDESVITMMGVVSVSAPKDLQQVPEGDRVMGARTFHTNREIFVTRNTDDPGTSDRILYDGEFWRVAQVSPYGQYGYWKAVAIRMSGD